MDHALSLGLHTLTARLDRAADRILRAEEDLSYRRFLLLFMVQRLDSPTQRMLAERLGVTEPSVSRMTGTLTKEGLLEAQPDPSGGNRRRLGLTPGGSELLWRCCELLEGRMAALAEAGGVPYETYTRHTYQLVAALDTTETTPRPSPPADDRA
jgi:DNA-binding MarR family transcriptional regulator